MCAIGSRWHVCLQSSAAASADEASYHAWRRGLAHLLLMLMAPDAPHQAWEEGGLPPRPPGAPPGSGVVQQQGARALVGRTTSRGLMGSSRLSASSGSGSGASLLQQLGDTFQELGKKVTPRRWQLKEGGSLQPSELSGTAAEGNADGSLRGGSPPGGKRAGDGSEAGTPRDQQRQEWAAHEAQQKEKRQRMAAYLQTVAAAANPALAQQRQQHEEQEAAAPQQQRVRQRRQSESGVASKGPKMVSVSVQTDESELSRRSTAAFGSGSLSRHVDPATPRPSFGAAATRPDSSLAPEGSDADVAGQYMAAMQAAGAAAGGAHSSQHHHHQQQQQQPMPNEATSGGGGGDADIAAHYMAAMSAAAGGGAAAAAATRGGAAGALPPWHQHPQQPQQTEPATSGGGDSDLAAHYLAAMQASAVGGGGGLQSMAATSGTPTLATLREHPQRRTSFQMQLTPFSQHLQPQRSSLSPASLHQQLTWRQQVSDRLGSPAATTPPHLQQALMTGTGVCHSAGWPCGVVTPPCRTALLMQSGARVAHCCYQPRGRL